MVFSPERRQNTPLTPITEEEAYQRHVRANQVGSERRAVTAPISDNRRATRRQEDRKNAQRVYEQWAASNVDSAPAPIQRPFAEAVPDPSATAFYRVDTVATPTGPVPASAARGIEFTPGPLSRTAKTLGMERVDGTTSADPNETAFFRVNGAEPGPMPTPMHIDTAVAPAPPSTTGSRQALQPAPTGLKQNQAPRSGPLRSLWKRITG